MPHQCTPSVQCVRTRSSIKLACQLHLVIRAGYALPAERGPAQLEAWQSESVAGTLHILDLHMKLGKSHANL